jgi:hypothetical protein
VTAGPPAGTAPPQVPPPAPADLGCPRCATPIRTDQDWCLACGAPARTRLAPTPNWRLPVAVLATVAAIALVALAIAFVALTRNDNAAVNQSTTTTPAAAPPATTAAPAPPTTAPGATTAPPPGG